MRANKAIARRSCDLDRWSAK